MPYLVKQLLYSLASLILFPLIAFGQTTCPEGTSAKDVTGCKACLDDSWTGAIRWKGACVSGVIDGPGTLTHYSESGPFWFVDLGPGTGISASGGLISIDLEESSVYRPSYVSFEYCKGLDCSGATDSCQLADEVEGVYGLREGLPGVPDYVSTRVVIDPKAQLQYDYILQTLVNDSVSRILRDCKSVAKGETNIRLAFGQKTPGLDDASYMRSYTKDGYTWQVCEIGKRLGRPGTDCTITDNIFAHGLKLRLRKIQENIAQAEQERKQQEEEEAAAHRVEAENLAKAQKLDVFLHEYGVQSVFSAILRPLDGDGPRLGDNPFAYEGMTVAFSTMLLQVIDRETGFFKRPNADSEIIITEIPVDLPVKKHILIAVRVVGNTADFGGLLPLAEYVGHVTCERAYCKEYLATEQ